MRATADLPLQLALVLLGAALYLPFLAVPLGPQEINAGYFFGPFAQAYERFGFFALRGVPLAPIEWLPAEPANGLPYFNHPPGFAWLSCTFATAEWRLRLPTALAGIAAGLLLFRLLRERMHPYAAAFAGLLAQTAPVMAFHAQVSYESVIVCCGLGLWHAFERAGAGSRTARIGLIVVSVAGPWLDWDFGFFVLALPLLAERGSFRKLVRRLALPWALSLASLGLVLLWVWWASTAPFVLAERPFTPPRDYLSKGVLLNWPPLLDFLRGVRDQLYSSYTLPLLVVAVPGLCWLLRRHTRFALALLLPGSLFAVLLPGHASSHAMFMALLLPAVTASCAVALSHCARAGARGAAVAVAGLLLLAVPVAVTLEMLLQNRSALFRELGAVLTEKAEEPTTDPAGRLNLVGTNAFQSYPYYVRSQRVYLFPVVEPKRLETIRHGAQRVRFLLLEPDLYSANGELSPVINQAAARPLAEYLRPFPSQRQSRLEGTWPLAGGLRLEIVRATLYDL